MRFMPAYGLSLRVKMSETSRFKNVLAGLAGAVAGGAMGYFAQNRGLRGDEHDEGDDTS
jgi:hypothetical protein